MFGESSRTDRLVNTDTPRGLGLPSVDETTARPYVVFLQ